MALFKRNKGPELRTATSDGSGMLWVEDALLKAMLSGDNVDRALAMQVPTVAGGIDIIAGIVASTPIKLFREDGEQTEEIRDDPRVRLLNDDPGDTLNAWEMKHAVIRDYYLEGSGFLYIEKKGTKWKSLRYVDARDVGYVLRGTSPIFRDFDYQVGGQNFAPYNFLRFLRNTRDGIKGEALLRESSLPIAAAYQSLLFEKNLLKKGGNLANLAATYSADQGSIADGELGSIGWMTQNYMIPGFEGIFEAKVGEPFVLNTQYGTHVVVVSDKTKRDIAEAIRRIEPFATVDVSYTLIPQHYNLTLFISS